MTDHQVSIEHAAQVTWDERVAAAGDIPRWADLDEDTRTRWRKSFTVAAAAMAEFFDVAFVAIWNAIPPLVGAFKRNPRSTK